MQLGLHPGFGGTVRAVRLLGVRPAMKLMLTGRNVRSDQALRLGLVDRLVATRDELNAAARQIIRDAPPPRRAAALERALSWPGLRALQVVHADDRGHWPWETGYRGVRGGQPVLGSRAPARRRAA